jgi:hypothetical protein
MAKENFNEIDNKGGVADLTAGSFGLNGFDILDDASPLNADARYYALLALSESQVNCENINDSQVHTLIPMVTGMQLFGVFKDVSVAAGGKVLAYKL